MTGLKFSYFAIQVINVVFFYFAYLYLRENVADNGQNDIAMYLILLPAAMLAFYVFHINRTFYKILKSVSE